jgi:large subunit ribosomal protein L15
VPHNPFHTMKEDLLPKGPNREKKRLGRGEGNGHGKTCCRGHKGAGARSGYSLRAGFEGGQMPLFRKLPQRGFNRTRFQENVAVVNLSDLSKVANKKIDLSALQSAGLVRSNAKKVKLLGEGEASTQLDVHVDQISASAKSKVEAAGGSVTLV